ncbi:MAG: large conductance mechanosensitive channel protein MscL [Bdellovibrionota bacterium]
MEEFKKFLAQGNVMDLAIGVIIGAAFGKIVNSLVNDILMPLIGLLMRGVNVTQKFIALDGNAYLTLEEAKTKGAAVLAYGNFLQALIDFLIIAFVLFIIVKQANKLKSEAPAAAPVK